MKHLLGWMYIEGAVIKVELDDHCPSTHHGGHVGWQEVTPKAKVKVKMSSSSNTVVLWVDFVCHPKMASNTEIVDLETLMLCQMHWLLIRLKCLNATIPTGILSAQTLEHLPGEDVHWASSSQCWVWCTLPFSTRRWPSWMTGSDIKGQRSRSKCQAVVMR